MIEAIKTYTYLVAQRIKVEENSDQMLARQKNSQLVCGGVRPLIDQVLASKPKRKIIHCLLKAYFSASATVDSIRPEAGVAPSVRENPNSFLYKPNSRSTNRGINTNGKPTGSPIRSCECQLRNGKPKQTKLKIRIAIQSCNGEPLRTGVEHQTFPPSCMTFCGHRGSRWIEPHETLWNRVLARTSATCECISIAERQNRHGP